MMPIANTPQEEWNKLTGMCMNASLIWQRGPQGFQRIVVQRESLHTTKCVSFIRAKLSAAEKKTESLYK